VEDFGGTALETWIWSAAAAGPGKDHIRAIRASSAPDGGYIMEPEASVSALVFHHPDCAYFSAAEESESAA
jgi:hypothetical protein